MPGCRPVAALSSVISCPLRFPARSSGRRWHTVAFPCCPGISHEGTQTAIKACRELLVADRPDEALQHALSALVVHPDSVGLHHLHEVACLTLSLSPPGAPLSQRHAAGKLFGAGLDEWVGQSAEEFIEKAVVATVRPEELERLRLSLRERMQGLNVARTQQDELPRVLRALWGRWCAGDQPR
jgi:hypothetical protein